MAFNRYVNLGSASASVNIDTSPAQNAIPQMQQIAQQITQIVNQINQQVASVAQIQTKAAASPNAPAAGAQATNNLGMSPQQLAQVNQQAAVFAQQQAAAQAQVTTQINQQTQSQKQNTAAAQDQFAITRAMVNELKTQVAEQQNLYRTATAQAPAGMDRSGVETQMRAARQPILEIEAELAKLKTAWLQATTPQQQAGIEQQLQVLQQKAQQAQQGVQGLSNSVSQFGQQVSSSRAGVEGYFNSVRENLEKINETSLAANLQEISFRLLPLGAAAAALTQRGVQMAQVIQETALSFNALTGSQDKTNALMKQLTDQASKLGLPLTTVLTVLQRFAPTIRQANGDLSQVVDLASRLLTLNPGAGFETAITAITKGLGGTDRSLLTQFNILPDDLKAAEKSAGSFAGGLNALLNQMGRGTALAQQFGETNRSAVTRMQDSIDKFLATSMSSYLNAMTGAEDVTSNFFNTLSSGNNIITTLTGGVITLVSSLSAGLITLGQFALAFNAIKAVVSPLGLGAKIGGVVEGLENQIVATLPTPILTAFSSAATGISTIIGTAVKIGVTVGLAGIAAAIGAALAIGIASVLGVGGTHDPAEQLNRLIESVSVGIGLLVVAIESAIAIFHNGGDLISAAFNNIKLIIGAAGDTLKDVFTHIQAVLLNVVGGIEVAVGNVLRTIAEKLAPYGDTGGLGLAGVNLSDQGKIDQFNAGEILKVPLHDFFADIAGQLVDLSKFKLLTPDQVTKIQNDASSTVLSVFNFISGILQPGKIVANAPAATGTGVPGANYPAGVDQDSLNAALKVINQIAEAEQNYAQQVKRTEEDRTISARRDAEDTAIARTRAAQDFALQQGRAEDDYYRSRQDSIDDFNRQTMQAQSQADDQRKKQQADYNTQALRAEQDHLRDMQRMARDITDAISARDFLSAQKTIEKMNDSETDFQTEQARRQEDFAKQMDDLTKSLKDQQDQRAADFALQLKRQQDSFNLQRQRQVDDYNHQQQLQVQDNARKLQRQAEDYALQDARRDQDFNKQINDLVNHNDILQGIWNNGLSQFRDSVKNFFTGLPAAIGGVANGTTTGSLDQTAHSIGATVGTIIGNVLRGFTDLGTGTPFANRGTAYDVGTWFVPQTMKATVHQGEIIVPPSISQRIREGQAGIGVGQSGASNVTVPMTVINGAGLDEDKLIEKAGTVLIPRISRALESQAKTTQPRRGWN